MPDYTVRPFRDMQDARPQFDLWLRATEELTRAWRSSLRNVEHQLENCAKYPRCRLYADRDDGALLGYVGTHPPFDWDGEQHGPPNEALGWAIPFGYPWTAPRDDDLAAVLYDEMVRAVPEMYADFRRDVYVQRFSESWTYPIEFLKQRGWRLHKRLPLIGRGIDDPGPPPPELVKITRGDLSLISGLTETDATAAAPMSTSALEQNYDGGWIVADTFRRLGERGAFALEQRGPWAAVTLFFAQPDAWDETLRAAAAQSAALGARELYFTIDPRADAKRLAALQERGFSEVDAGVYYVRDAD
jgi:hypothetical protein